MASMKYLLAITFVIIIACNFVLSAPVSSQEAVAKEKNDSEESPENVDKPIPAKANAAALNEQDTNESSDSDAEAKDKPEHAHKHRDHSSSDHIDVVEGNDDGLKAKKVDDGDDDDSAVKGDKASDKASKSAKKTDSEKSAALEADKPAATSESEEEEPEAEKKPLVDNTYPKAPAATAAEDRQQASRETADKVIKSDDTKNVHSDSDSASDDSNDKKNEEVPAPMKGSGTMTQEQDNEGGVANLTEDKQMDERQDGITINGSTTKSPNAGISASTSYSLIFLSIMLYLLQ